MGEHRQNHGDRQELGGDRARGEDPGRSVVYDRRRDGDNIERDRPGGRERRRSSEWELGGDGREAGEGVERQGEEARVGRALNKGAVSLSAIKLGGSRNTDGALIKAVTAFVSWTGDAVAAAAAAAAAVSRISVGGVGRSTRPARCLQQG